MNMEPLVPHVLLEDKDYKVFLDLISVISSDIKELIIKFPELVDIDNAPEIFLPKLTALIRYKYRYDINEDVQREIIKRIISIYRDRGTDDAIIMAATYGNDPLWIGSHVFLPGADTTKDRATITHPVNLIFRHNISRHSGLHRFADATRWTAGTLIINVTYIDDQIREAIKKVIPAGLRIYFDISSQFQGDGELGEVVFGEWVLTEFYELDYSLAIVNRVEALVFDVRAPGRRLLSGRQVLFDSSEIEIYKGFSMLPIEDKSLNNIQVKDLKATDIVKCIDSSGNTVYMQLGQLVKSYGFFTTQSDEYSVHVFKKLFDLKLDDWVYVDNTKENGQIESDYLSFIIHDINYQINGVYIKPRHQGLPRRSTSTGKRSDKYAFDGIYTGEISYICPIEDVVPSDRWYPMTAIEELKPGEYLKDYCTPVDIEIYTDSDVTELTNANLDSVILDAYDQYVPVSDINLNYELSTNNSLGNTRLVDNVEIAKKGGSSNG